METKLNEEIIAQVQEENQLTDEQVESIVEALHPVTDTEDIPEFFPHNVLNKEGQMVKGAAEVEIDPDTGLHRIVGEIKQNNVASFTDVIEGTDKEQMSVIPKDTIEGLIEMGLSEEETQDLYNVILKYKSGEKFSIYNEVPKTVKAMIDNVAMSKNPKVINQVSKGILDFFVNQLNIEQEFIDLQESIKKELDIPGVADMYAEHLRKSMEIDLLEKANKIEAEYPDKARQLRHVSNTYTDSYKMTLMHLELDCNTKVIKKIHKDLKKFNKHCREFNFKYQDSKFKINDITLLVNCLGRHLDERKISMNDIKKFILLFTNICRDMKSDNIIEHTFMYYTIKNILTIEHLEKDNTFYKEIIKNVESVIAKIQTIEREVL